MLQRFVRSAAALVFVLAVAAPPAQAVICAVDDVPAATLLLPYFEVNLEHWDEENTLFSINNASATAVLAHVVVWSDLSVPVLDFNIYLTGYDVQTINLRDILMKGMLPQTASVGQDPADTISPQGPLSQDINFASCNNQLPLGNLPAAFVAHLGASLTGQMSPLLGGCVGLDHGDPIARGYITVDTVNSCTLDFPGDPGYFGGPVTNQNVLWGDYFYMDVNGNTAQGEPLVHIEASAVDPATTTPGSYTFYGRYVGWLATDNREPLASAFAARYVTGGAFDAGTDYIVWRDSKSQVPDTGWACNTIGVTNPPWYPLAQEGITFFDEEEQTVTPEGCRVSPCPDDQLLVPFPAETQRVEVGGDDLPTPFPFGWTWMDLDTFVAGQVDGLADPTRAQAWAVVSMTAEGRYSVGYSAVQLESVCSPRLPLPR